MIFSSGKFALVCLQHELFSKNDLNFSFCRGKWLLHSFITKENLGNPPQAVKHSQHPVYQSLVVDLASVDSKFGDCGAHMCRLTGGLMYRGRPHTLWDTKKVQIYKRGTVALVHTH